MSDPKSEPRGVENPRVIDLVTDNPETGEVVLLMLEPRPWADEATERSGQLKQIEDKFNAYLSYVLGGFLVKDYPQYAEKKVSIQLDCTSPPQAEQQAFFTAMRNFAESENIRFALNICGPGPGGARATPLRSAAPHCARPFGRLRGARARRATARGRG